MRVLHVIRSLNVGGAEGWLVRLLRHVPRGVIWDFLVQTRGPWYYEQAVLSYGGRIYSTPDLRDDLPGYCRGLLNVLNRFGPYDVVHTHQHLASGVTLLVAARAGVPGRIAHSHTSGPRMSGWPPGYGQVMRFLIYRYATGGIASSSEAAEALFGSKWNRDGRISVLPISIDPDEWQDLPDRPIARETVGVGCNDLVLGHVGRFVREKNHGFLLRVLEALVSRGHRVKLVLVGDGPLRERIEQEVCRRQLADKVLFAGLQADLRQYYAAFDVFLFPSLFEGFPTALLEAQACGVPAVVSIGVPGSTIIGTMPVRRLSLDVSTWVAAAEELVFAKDQRRVGLSGIRGTLLDVRVSVQELIRFYERVSRRC